MRAVFVFCEGNHDAVFVTRSLGTVAGALWLGEPVGKLPSPFGVVPDPNSPRTPKVKSFIAERYSDRALEGLSLSAAAHSPPPTFEALLRIEPTTTLFAIVRSSGDGAAQAAERLLGDFRSLLLPGLGCDVQQIAAAFLFDADDPGVVKRELAFAASHAGILSTSAQPRHATWDVGADFPVGLYVFHDHTTRAGTLEQHLAPLVEAQWPARWNAAEEYLTTHQLATDPVATKLSERLKAKISITGQFRFPGDPMTQVIKDRDGLPRAHFGDGESRLLADFLTGVPW